MTLAHVAYGNSQDEMSLLVGGVRGAIAHLHGTLRSKTGLILTSSQYRELATGDQFEYWRTKLTAIFSMQRIVIVGYSLRDPHITAVVEAAKRGSMANRPVCWMAPDVTPSDAAEYYSRYRIRVIPYPSGSDHAGLTSIVRTVSRFTIRRAQLTVRPAVAAVLEEATRGDRSAAAVYVFNRVSPRVDLEVLRLDVAVASIEAALPRIGTAPFGVEGLLRSLGWPADVEDSALSHQVARRLVEKGMVRRDSGALVALPDAPAARQHRLAFEHLRSRFRTSVSLRIQRECSWIDVATASSLAESVDNALTGFFMRGGLTIATLIVSGKNPPSTVPSSLIPFITEASAQFDELGLRIAFWQGAIGALADATEAEREYLGRLAHGFLAFHVAGVFGDAARAQLQNARETVWLVDSSLLIPALARRCTAYQPHLDVFNRMASARAGVMTTQKLASEVVEHLGFARRTVARFGADSVEALSAAIGDPPYWRQNLFVEGFLYWQAAGRGTDWASYLWDCFGTLEPDPMSVVKRIEKLGVRVLDFQDWPGFQEQDFVLRDEFVADLTAITRAFRGVREHIDAAFAQRLAAKIPPEAEAAVIVLREREGVYQAISDRETGSPAWFISATSSINLLDRSRRITWQPEAFMGYVRTLVGSEASLSAETAFEAVLWAVAQSGLQVIPDAVLESVFGRVIDQDTLQMEEQRETYARVLGDKYGEHPDDVIRRLPMADRLAAASRMNRELVDRQAQDLRVAQARNAESERRARAAESTAADLTAFKRRLGDRQALAARRRRQKGLGRKRKP